MCDTSRARAIWTPSSSGDALLELREAGSPLRLRTCITVDDPTIRLVVGDGVGADGDLTAELDRSDSGYTVGPSHPPMPREHTRPAKELQLRTGDKLVDATACEESLFDPDDERVLG